MRGLQVLGVIGKTVFYDDVVAGEAPELGMVGGAAGDEKAADADVGGAAAGYAKVVGFEVGHYVSPACGRADLGAFCWS